MKEQGSWFERFWASVLLAAVGVATCGACWGVTPEPRALPSPLFMAFADSQWQQVLACTHLTPQKGGHFEDVVWQIVPHGNLVAGHNYLLGLWVAPDTIKLDSNYAFVSWVVEHELLHHLLRGPPVDQGGPHPWAPFAVPCGVMSFQHLLKEF